MGGEGARRQKGSHFRAGPQGSLQERRSGQSQWKRASRTGEALLAEHPGTSIRRPVLEWTEGGDLGREVLNSGTSRGLPRGSENGREDTCGPRIRTKGIWLFCHESVGLEILSARLVKRVSAVCFQSGETKLTATISRRKLTWEKLPGSTRSPDSILQRLCGKRSRKEREKSSGVKAFLILALPIRTWVGRGLLRKKRDWA